MTFKMFFILYLHIHVIPNYAFLISPTKPSYFIISYLVYNKLSFTLCISEYPLHLFQPKCNQNSHIHTYLPIKWKSNASPTYFNSTQFQMLSSHVHKQAIQIKCNSCAVMCTSESTAICKCSLLPSCQCTPVQHMSRPKQVKCRCSHFQLLSIHVQLPVICVVRSEASQSSLVWKGNDSFFILLLNNPSYDRTSTALQCTSCTSRILPCTCTSPAGRGTFTTLTFHLTALPLTTPALDSFHDLHSTALNFFVRNINLHFIALLVTTRTHCNPPKSPTISFPHFLGDFAQMKSHPVSFFIFFY